MPTKKVLSIAGPALLMAAMCWFVFGVATYLFWRRNTSWRNTAPPLAAALTLAA